MKQVLTGTCLAAAFAVGLSAQTPQTPPTQAPQNPPAAAAQERSADAKTVTVTGCLKAGESSDSFILSDLKFGSGASAVGTSGTAGTAGAAGAPPAALASATTLTIKPKGDAKLSEHVGHKVEVSGNVAEKTASASPSPADPAAPAARPSSAGGPTFEARTVKMIAQTCAM